MQYIYKMKKFIIIIFLFGLFVDYSHAQTRQQLSEALGELGRRADVKIRTKKSKKTIEKWEKAGDFCAVQCHRLNQQTGEIDYDFKCENDCNNRNNSTTGGGNISSNTNNSFANTEAERIKAEEEAKRQAEIQRQKAEEEARRQAEIQRQEAERKIAEERKNAIQKIETAKISGYHFDETALSQNQKSELDVIADVLSRYSDIRVLIIGHTCEIGYKNINQKIGLKRAEAGKEYLIGKGIAAERISVDSKGATQPLVQNTSNENRKQNRRIEFVIE